jgi:hypothetical protein
MIEVPVRVDEMRHRFRPNGVERLGDLGSRHGDAAIDEQLALSPAQHSDVAARSFQHRNPATKRIGGYGSDGGGRLDRFDDAACLGERFLGPQTDARGDEGRGRGAAQAEAPTRHIGDLGGHDVRSRVHESDIHAPCRPDLSDSPRAYPEGTRRKYACQSMSEVRRVRLEQSAFISDRSPCANVVISGLDGAAS